MIDALRVTIRVEDPSIATERAVVLPVAHDAGWRASSGRVHSVGGLVAVVGLNQRETTLEFVPDGTAVLRAVSMTVAQILAVIGFIGLVSVGRVASNDVFELGAKWERLVSRVAPKLRPLRQWRTWLYIGFSIAVLRRLEWQPGDSETPGLLTGLLLPATTLIVARLAQRERWHRWGGWTLVGCALAYVVARGSRAAAALHDPLFWGLLAVAALGISAITRRWRGATWTASAIAGSCAAIATLLPLFPDFESRGPQIDLDVARQALLAISDQLGILATVLLFGCWCQAMTAGGSRESRTSHIGAATRGALAASLFFVLCGAWISAPIEPGRMVALGVLFGLAEARTAHARESVDRNHSGGS